MRRSWGSRLWRRGWRGKRSGRRAGRRRGPADCSPHTRSPRCCRTGNTDYTSRTDLMLTWRVVMRPGRSWYNVFTV